MSFCTSVLSGSTGKPKGVLHTTAGYMLYAATTFKYSFDYHDDDVYWCTADVGWITGHSYITYGPMANGATGIIVSLCTADTAKRGFEVGGGAFENCHSAFWELPVVLSTPGHRNVVTNEHPCDIPRKGSQ